MDPKFQTSFIPKKQVVTGGASSSVTTIPDKGNFAMILSESIFVVVLVLCAFLFGYKLVLKSQIDKANADLVAARSAFEPATIQTLITASSRIAATKTLLNNHIVVSSLFNLLQSLTVKSVRLSNFTYANSNNVLKVSADVEAQSYNSLFQQSMLFTQNAFMLQPTFSNFDVSDNGFITAKFVTGIDPNLISYKKAIELMNEVNPQQTEQKTVKEENKETQQ